MSILDKKVNFSILFLFISNYIGEFISYGRYIKYISFIMVAIYFICAFYKYKLPINIRNNVSKDFIIIGFIFIILSGFIQVYHNESRLFLRTIQEVLFIILPAIIVFLISNLKIENYKKIFNNLMILLVIMFIIKYNKQITIKNILSIDFINSFSPFESEYADYFMFLYIYFLYNGNRKQYIICLLFSILSLKRLNLIIIIIYYLYIKFSRNKKTYNNTIKSKILLFFMIIFNIIAVFILLIVTTEEFSTKFYQIFNISLNQFTLGRFYLVNYIKNNNSFLYKGFGSTSVFINSIGFDNIHLDNLKIFFELGVLGIVIFYFFYYRYAVKYPKILFIMFLYNLMYCVTFTMSNIMSNLLLLLLITSLEERRHIFNSE